MMKRLYKPKIEHTTTQTDHISPLPVCFRGDGGWAGPNPGPPGPQQLSVVTTVWGMTPSTQSGPFVHNPQYPTTSMTGASANPMGGGGGGGAPPRWVGVGVCTPVVVVVVVVVL
ncbi:hypothetical protein ACOMHN_030296 [Nucella lapillus]